MAPGRSPFASTTIALRPPSVVRPLLVNVPVRTARHRARFLGASVFSSDRTMAQTDSGTLTHRPASFEASAAPCSSSDALQYTALAFK